MLKKLLRMKKHLRLFLINFVSLWLAGNAFAGVSFSGNYQTLALAALVLTLINFALKPLIKIMLLPINLITMGAFRWLINVLSLYLVTIIVSQFQIESFLFAGFNYQGFTIPSIYLSTFWALVVVSLFISLVTTFLLWLIK